ncbi:glycosyltransferase [Sphingomonas sp.]|uniref:glycosyltransferase n=1 Tax=Sphingomonas sp. TaxID=28214 RepID=UPI003D6CD8CC
MKTPRIVLATIGSLGDLHPFIAIALALKARGASPVLAVPQDHVEKCRAAGVEAEALLPTFEEVGRATGLDEDVVIRKVIDDTHFLVSHVLLPPLADSTGRLLRIAAGADLLVGSAFALAGPIVAERLAIPFVSIILQPMSWFSPSDPPVAPGFAALARPPLGVIRTGWNRFVLGGAKLEMRRRYGRRVNRVRAAHGLARSHAAPILEPGTPPVLSLGTYSSELAALPAEASNPALLTGFPWFDSADGMLSKLDPELAAFLAKGPPPLIVSLGSFLPFAAADFYQRSAAIAAELGMRAVLLTGEAVTAPSRDMMVCGYAPHSLLFPYAAAIIHHGGVGTTGQALRAGKPQLVVPFMGDQFDHADRIARLGVGLSMTPGRFATEGASLIQRLLDHPGFSTTAATIGKRVANEDGAGLAAERILGLLPTTRRHPVAWQGDTPSSISANI